MRIDAHYTRLRYTHAMGTRARTVETLPDKALAANTQDVQRKVPDYALLARLIIREGKPFNYSALQAGYSESVAKRNLATLMAESRPVTEAIERETKAISINPQTLKPMAILRLHREIADIDSPNGMRAIELAGRLRENDWFVRNNETTVGVFLSAGEIAPDPIEVLPTKYEE